MPAVGGHDYILRAHGSMIERVDQPIASSGSETTRSFGRDSGFGWANLVTPDNGIRGGGVNTGGTTIQMR